MRVTKSVSIWAIARLYRQPPSRSKLVTEGPARTLRSRPPPPGSRTLGPYLPTVPAEWLSRGRLAPIAATPHLGAMTQPLMDLAVPHFDVATLPDNLDAGLLARVIALRDWLLLIAAEAEKPNDILTGFAERLNALGVPIDRIFSVIETLHSEYAGIGRSWTRENGAATRYLPHGERREIVYGKSPFAHVNRTGEWLLLDLEQTPDDLFPIITELKEGGYRYYLTVPVRFTIGAESGISFATRSPDGFGEQGLKVLSLVMPTF